MRTMLAVVLGAFLLGAIPTTSLADDEEIKVMTQNLYLGADLNPVLAAAGTAAFPAVAAQTLQTIAVNDFPLRAQALAQIIAKKRPHLIGLQEVFDFTFDAGGGPTNGPPPFVDHLTTLLNAINGQPKLIQKGITYAAISSVDNIDLQVPGIVLPPPFPPVPVTIGIKDRDVILVRNDVITANATGANFSCALLGPFPTCAPLPPGLGAPFVLRGYATVDATVGAQTVRFANTHLEVKGSFPGIQAAQAQEFIAALGGSPLPVIAVGDFNSSPDDPASLPFPPPFDVPPYEAMWGAGYDDAWVLREEDDDDPSPGFTCCQGRDVPPGLNPFGLLVNPVSSLDERIDLIFVDTPVEDADAKVVANKPLGLVVPNWPSDHAGVLAEFEIEDDD